MTQLQIINLALRNLGMSKIANLNGVDPSTTVMLDFWDICKLSMFEEHQWAFANVQQALVKSSIDVPLGWTFAYDYPTENCAAVWTVFNEGTLADKDGQDFDTYLDKDSGLTKLVSNLDAAIVEYTFVVDDPETWPNKFAYAMAYFLAASACPLLTGDADKAMKLLTLYSAIISEVQRVDSFKSSKKVKIPSTYQNSRG